MLTQFQFVECLECLEECVFGSCFRMLAVNHVSDFVASTASKWVKGN